MQTIASHRLLKFKNIVVWQTVIILSSGHDLRLGCFIFRSQQLRPTAARLEKDRIEQLSPSPLPLARRTRLVKFYFRAQKNPGQL
jgi:hypothetical protein